MFKELSTTKTFLIGCILPLLWIVVYKTSKKLGIDWDAVLEVVGAAILFLSLPWSFPAFAIPREIAWMREMKVAGYIEALGLLMGFGLNFLFAFKLGIRLWLIRVVQFATVLAVLALIFALYMLFR